MKEEYKVVSNIKNKKMQLKAMLLALTIILTSNGCFFDKECREESSNTNDSNSISSESEEPFVHPTLEEFLNKYYYTEDDIVLGISMGIIVTIQTKGSPWYTYCIKDFDDNSPYTPPAGYSAYEELVGVGVDENGKVTYIKGGVYHDVPTHAEQFLLKK